MLLYDNKIIKIHTTNEEKQQKVFFFDYAISFY